MLSFGTSNVEQQHMFHHFPIPMAGFFPFREEHHIPSFDFQTATGGGTQCPEEFARLKCWTFRGKAERLLGKSQFAQGIAVLGLWNLDEHG